MFYTYILQGSTGRYYVGYTQDLHRRLLEHKKQGSKKYTSKIGEISLIGYFECDSKEEAIQKEKQIKRSGHISRWIEEVNFINTRH